MTDAQETIISSGFVDAGRIGRRVFLGDLTVQDNFAAGRCRDERLPTDKIRPIQCMEKAVFCLVVRQCGGIMVPVASGYLGPRARIAFGILD
jgi:hypothetical protein